MGLELDLDELQVVRELVTMCRENGVTRARVGAIEIELSPRIEQEKSIDLESAEQRAAREARELEDDIYGASGIVPRDLRAARAS